MEKENMLCLREYVCWLKKKVVNCTHGGCGYSRCLSGYIRPWKVLETDWAWKRLWVFFFPLCQASREGETATGEIWDIMGKQEQKQNEKNTEHKAKAIIRHTYKTYNTVTRYAFNTTLFFSVWLCVCARWSGLSCYLLSISICFLFTCSSLACSFSLWLFRHLFALLLPFSTLRYCLLPKFYLLFVYKNFIMILFYLFVKKIFVTNDLHHRIVLPR